MEPGGQVPWGHDAMDVDDVELDNAHLIDDDDEDDFAMGLGAGGGMEEGDDGK